MDQIAILLIGLLTISVIIMFMWEGKVRWWLRLPIINLFVFIFLFIAGCIEEVYLTFHPNKRTKWIKSSIFQIFFS